MSNHTESILACPECGGKRVIARVNNVGGTLRLVYPPDALATNTIAFETYAKICTNCGYAALFVEDPQRINRKIVYEDDLAARKAAMAARKAVFDARRAARKAESRGGKPLVPPDES